MKATTMEHKAEGVVIDNVAEPLRRAFRTAAHRVDGFAAETRSVASRVETEMKKAAGEVREKGKELASDPRAFMETVVKQSKKRAEKVTGDVSKEAKRISDDVSRRVTHAVEVAVEKTLHRFNVPTHKELQKLTNKVDALGAKIDAMRRTKTAKKPARPAARRTTKR